MEWGGLECYNIYYEMVRFSNGLGCQTTSRLTCSPLVQKCKMYFDRRKANFTNFDKQLVKLNAHSVHKF